MTVAIVPITRDLGTTVGSVQSALVLVSLVTASFVPTSQNLGDIYGHKKLFVMGLSLFGAGLVVTAFSPNVTTLILGYSIIGGLGATPLVTLPWMLMNRSYEGRRREFALSALTVAIVAGSLVGPLVGGYLSTTGDWRWAFGPQVGVVIIIWLLARPIPEIVRAPDTSIDWFGGLMSFLGLATILLGIDLANDYGWWTPKKVFRIGSFVIPPFTISIVPVMFVIGLIFLAVFAFYWRHRVGTQNKTLLWRLGLFRRRNFAVGVATSVFFAISTAGLTFTLYLFLQTTLGMTSFDTALAILPYHLTMILAMVATFRLGWWLFPKHIIQIGLVGLMIGLWLLHNSLFPGISAGHLIPGLVVTGTGAGLVVGQIYNLALSVADLNARGEASGIYNTFQDLGYSLGISIFGVGLIFLFSTSVVDGVLEKLDVTVTETQRQEIVIEVESLLHTTSSMEELDVIVAQLPQHIRLALAAVADKAQFEAMQLTLLGIMFVVLLALMASVFLPRQKIKLS